MVPTSSETVNGIYHVPLMNIYYINCSVGVSLPSPQLGSSFTFPPITPTALIAPINLPGKFAMPNAQMLLFCDVDLNNDDPLSVNSTGASSNGSSTPSRKRKANSSPIEQ